MNDKMIPQRSKNAASTHDEEEPLNRGSAHTTRAQSAVHEAARGADDEDRPWEPPSNLSAPAPRPGMSQRWIRTHVHGEVDVANVQKSFTEGWKPVRADSVEQTFYAPTISEGQWAGCIGVHGILLCEMPTKRLEQRTAYYAAQTKLQTQAVEQDLARESHPGMPITQIRRSSVSSGRIPNVADDAA